MRNHRESGNGPTDATIVPVARVTGLVVTETAGEVLVYDTATHHIHHLDRVSAVTWRLCDGLRTLDDLVGEVRLDCGPEVDTAVVRVALTKLDDVRLLEQPLAPSLRVTTSTRRSLVKRAAVASAIPAIVSISAPSAAAANSQCVNPGGNPSGASCFVAASCCSNVCEIPPGMGSRQCR